MIDLCTQWEYGVVVTTERADSTLSFIQYVVCMFESQTGLNVEFIVCDGDKEFVNTAWEEWLASTGILRECTSQAAPEQNAHLERFNQIVLCRACAGMLQSNLPASYLPYPLNIAIDEYTFTLASTNPISLKKSMFNKQPAFGSKARVLVNATVRGKVTSTINVDRGSYSDTQSLCGVVCTCCW